MEYISAAPVNGYLTSWTVILYKGTAQGFVQLLLRLPQDIHLQL